ncbi:MAG: transcriptional repressor LexA [Armatimonadetes bacterium]|nr:transcriptional repressor LexA [Armatimonadota bacterium]
MKALTDKQRQILETIRRGIEKRGHAPTLREIGATVGLSSSCTVKKHLDSLEAKGHIRRGRYKRSIELMEGGAPVPLGRSVCVPLLGRVAGGAPILAEQSAAPEMLPLPVSLLRRGESGNDLFALEVYGDSMRGVGIADGDLVVARRQETASDGDIVVALLDDEATVKTFYREPDGIRLQPENPDYTPILSRDVRIMGKVAMAIKRF